MNGLPRGPDYRDLALEELADSEARLRADNHTLVDLVADLAFENFILRQGYKRELLERICGDVALARYHRADQRARDPQPPTDSRPV